jgi:hypothetical protein
MVDQATLNGGDPRLRSPRGVQQPGQKVVRKVSDFAHDFATLAELQGELLANDLRKTAGRLTLPAGLAAGALGLLLGGTFVLLVAAANALVELGDFSAWSAYLIVGCVGLLVAAALGYFAWQQAWQGLRGFDDSRRELIYNWRWLRSSLKSAWTTDGERRSSGQP